MIGPPTGVRVYLACGYTDMRKRARGLTMLVQEALGKNPFAEGTVYFLTMTSLKPYLHAVRSERRNRGRLAANIAGPSVGS